MDVIVNIAIGLSLLVVLATFIMGMFAFAQNGKEAGARLNKAMEWRVRTQIVAIGILILSMVIKAGS